MKENDWFPRLLDNHYTVARTYSRTLAEMKRRPPSLFLTWMTEELSCIAQKWSSSVFRTKCFEIRPLLKRNKYPSSILVVSCIRANFHFFLKVRILTYLYNLWLTVRGVCRPFLIVFLKWDVKLKLCSTVLRVWMLFERDCELLLRMFYKLNVRTNQIEKLDNENILYFWVGCFWVCSVLHVHVTESAN